MYVNIEVWMGGWVCGCVDIRVVSMCFGIRIYGCGCICVFVLCVYVYMC